MSKLTSFALGDRVKPTSGPYRRTEFQVLAVEGDRISVKASRASKLKLVFLAKLLRPVPKDKARALVNPPKTIAGSGIEVKAEVVPNPPKLAVDQNGQPLNVGETVSFEQYWNGSRQQFEGTITKLNEPVGTAIVHFKAPEAKDLKELQAPIGVFVRAKTPDDLSEADSIRTEIAKIKASGNLAPDNCWIDWKPQAGDFVQWVWRSNKPMFQAIRGGGLVKTSYIKGADTLKEARAAVERRNAVRELEKQLKNLGKINVEPTQN